MSDHAEQSMSMSPPPRVAPSFPRLPLYGALALIAFACAATVFGRITDIGTVRVRIGEPVAMRDLVLTRIGDGRIVVADAGSGATIEEIPEGEGGFVRGSLRGLERLRLVREVPNTVPYRLIRWDSGAVSLSDTGTGERIYLDAFGPDNAAAFARFLNRAPQ